MAALDHSDAPPRPTQRRAPVLLVAGGLLAAGLVAFIPERWVAPAGVSPVILAAWIVAATGLFVVLNLWAFAEQSRLQATLMEAERSRLQLRQVRRETEEVLARLDDEQTG